MRNQVVITGIGILSGLGIGREKIWNAIKENKHAIKIINEWPDYEIGRQYFGQNTAFNLREYLNLKPPFPNMYSQLGLLTAHLAIEDSGLDIPKIDPFEIGCIMNTSLGSNESVEKYLIKLFEKGPKSVSPLTFTQTTNNHIVGDIARYNNLKGPNSIVMGEDSFSIGLDCIQTNQAKVMLCGGVDHMRSLRVFVLGENNELLSPLSDNPDDLFSPKAHNNSKNKYIVGEAACFLILEEKEHAIKRRANIYAEIVNTISYCDHNAARENFSRTNKVLEDLLVKATSKANISLDDLDMIMGSSTMPWLMNEYELEVMNTLKIKGKYTSVLTRIGECLGASASFSLATAAMAIKNEYIPGCLYGPEFFSVYGQSVCNYGESNSKLNFAAVNSNYVGGSSSCTILKKMS